MGTRQREKSRVSPFCSPTHMTTVTYHLSLCGHGLAARTGLIGVPFDSGPRCGQKLALFWFSAAVACRLGGS